MILAILSGLAAAWAGIAALRRGRPAPSSRFGSEWGTGGQRSGQTAFRAGRAFRPLLGLARLRRELWSHLAVAARVVPRPPVRGRLAVTVAVGWSYGAGGIADAGIEAAGGQPSATADRHDDRGGPTKAGGTGWPSTPEGERSLPERRSA